MAHEIKADHTKIFLLPASIEDWVPTDHPVRMIREFVNMLDMREMGFKVRGQREDGAPSYSSELLLGAWLYGYFYRIYSSRKLESSCRRELPLIWLTSCNYPDHNTLWRFWRDNKSGIKAVFRKTVLAADKLGMVGMVINAVDGTKIRSVSTLRTAWRKKHLTEKLISIDASIEQMERQLAEADQAGEPDEKLPQALTSRKALREGIRESLSQLDASGRDNLHPNEPDARVMTTADGGRLCYNAQACVDGASQIIVAAELTSEENDAHQMMPMLDSTKEMMGKVAMETLFDSGYDTGDQLAEAETHECNVLVNEKRAKEASGNPFHTSNFSYDPETDAMVCPLGEALEFEGQRRTPKSEDPVRRFRCKNRGCPAKSQCSKDPKGRAVEAFSFKPALDRQNQKRRSPEARQRLRRRSVIVEPVFAYIKHHAGFKRFTFCGIESAAAQWKMVCAVQNLRKIFSWLNQEWATS